MSWRRWVEELHQNPEAAVTDLLRGGADISPFERVTPHEFLLAILPRRNRLVSSPLLGEPHANAREFESLAGLPALLDTGLTAWLLARRQEPYPAARKLGAYVAQVCEALQWPQYFQLPRVRAALEADRVLWIKWLSGLTLSAYRDPEFEYWRALAVDQADDRLQFFWQSFVVEAGRSRSERYLNLGLLAFARLPLSEEDSLRNLRLQAQAFVSRYQRRKAWGTLALEELAKGLRGIIARNPSMSADNYQKFLAVLLEPLGIDTKASILSLLGMDSAVRRESLISRDSPVRLRPPGMAEETDHAVHQVNRSSSLVQAWNAVSPLLRAHEDYMRKSGDAYYFVRVLDRCGRALCEKYSLTDPEIKDQLLHWIRVALRIDADDPRLWMLWELALRKADHPQRAMWVLWEMTKRFPDQLPCRVELARMLATSDKEEDKAEAKRLLRQVLLMDLNNLHAYSTIAQLAIARGDWEEALTNAGQGLQIDPEDEHSVVLLAKAHARRDQPGDLQAAIDRLQHFTSRYSGKFHAEQSLRNLLQRQQSAIGGKLPAWDEDHKTTVPDVASVETDPAWIALAESVQAASIASNEPEDESITSTDRLLPLPLALKQAVTHAHWNFDLPYSYDSATRQEYPLEIRLWDYLQSLSSTEHGSNEYERAKQNLQAWIEIEKRVNSENSIFWRQYLENHWAAATGPIETAVKSGSEWLQELLDRYRPMPAPLLA